MLKYARPSSYPPGGFVTVPTAALSLPPNALKVLLVALHWNPKSHRSFTQASVVRACPELGRDAVRSAFTVLVDAKLLTRDPGPRGSTVYTLHAWDAPASDEPTSDGPMASDDPAPAASDDPTPNTQEEQSQTPLPPAPHGTEADAAVRVVEEVVDLSDDAEVRRWTARLVEALPVGARPATMPARLLEVATPWCDFDPGAVADVVAAGLPPVVRSPAGLLISKLAGGITAEQVTHAKQRREFAERRRAAALDAGAAGANEADDGSVVLAGAAAGYAASIRSQLAPRAVGR